MKLIERREVGKYRVDVVEVADRKPPPDADENHFYVRFEIRQLYYEGGRDKPVWELQASGDIKWDGCVNWSAGTDCMVHFCGRDDVEDFGKALTTVYEMASDAIGGVWF